jgi:hypothetical protein
MWMPTVLTKSTISSTFIVLISELEESFDPQKSWPDRKEDDVGTQILDRKIRITKGPSLR